MGWTTPKDWTSGALTSAELDTYVSDNAQELYDRLTLHGITSSATLQAVKSARYGVSLRRALYSVADTSDVAVPFAVSDEDWKDDAAYHSDTNSERVFAPTDGTYDIDAYASFAANSTGWRSLWVRLNGSTDYRQLRVPSAGSNVSTAIAVSFKMELSATDYLVCYVRHNSGAALQVSANLQLHRRNS